MRPPIDEADVKNTMANTLIALALVAFGLVMAFFAINYLAPHERHGTRAEFAQSVLGLLDDGLQRFYKDVGRYPTDDEGLKALFDFPLNRAPYWSGPYVVECEDVPHDPWGDDYIYRCPGKNGKPFDLYSCGPSGVDRGGSGDNISDPNAGK